MSGSRSRHPFRFISRSPAAFLAVVVLSFLVTSCGGGHKPVSVNVPPAPPIAQPPVQTVPKPKLPDTEAKKTEPEVEQKPSAVEDAEVEKAEEEKTANAVPPDTKPILVETGLASWYGPPFHNRRASNGEIYNMHAFTAAHRTLPLGSIVRVTNVKTGSSAIVRITDRGPFIDGRVIDLSLAAAKKTEVWRAGVATVRIEVLKTPVPLDDGGRWAVQIGGFNQHDAANEVADHVSRRYHTAKILCFNSPAGDWWVRIRVKDDDRKRAEEVAHNTQTSQGSIFLVRLD